MPYKCDSITTLEVYIFDYQKQSFIDNVSKHCYGFRSKMHAPK